MKALSYSTVLLAVGTLYYALEVLGTLAASVSLPFSPAAFLLGWILVLAWGLCVAGFVGRFNRPGPAPWLYLFCTAGSVLFIVVKFRLVLGPRSLWTPSLLYLLLPLTLAALWDVFLRGRPDPRWAGFVVFLIGIASTDLIQSFWLRTRADASSPVLLGVGAAVVLLLGLIGGSTLTDRLKARERVFHRAPVILVLLIAGVVSAALFTGFTPTGPFGLWGSRSLEGSSPRGLTLTDEDTVRDLPNIILISVDTLRWDMVPPRARERRNMKLPALRELRRDSIDFTGAFSTTGWTLPSHASLFTGVLPVRHHAVKLQGPSIREETTTFPTYLDRLGYHTAGYTDNGAISRAYGFDRGFDVYWEQSSPNAKSRRLARQLLPLKSTFLPGPVEGWLALSGAFPGLFPALRRPIEDRPHMEKLARRAGWQLPFRHDLSVRIPPEVKLRYFHRNLSHAKQWVRSRSSSPRPFFLFLHTYQVHDYGYARADKPLYPGDLQYLRQWYPSPLAAYPEAGPDEPFDPEVDPTGESVWERFRSLEFPDLPPRYRRRFRERLRGLSARERRIFREYLGLWVNRGERPFELMVERLQFYVLSSSKSEWERFLELPPKRQRSLLGPSREALRSLDMAGIQARLTKLFFYRHMVESVGEKIGRFTEFLKESGLYRDSLIVFVSDHGQGFQVTDRTMGHCCGQLSEVLLKVPIWMKLPGERSAGATVSRPIQIQDVFPMIFDYLGVRRPGKSWFTRSQESGRVPFRLPDRDVLLGSSTVGLHHSHPRHYRRFAHDGDYKVVKASDTAEYNFWRVRPGSMLQFEVPRSRVPAGRREKLMEALREHRRLFTGPSNPYRKQTNDIDTRLKRNLEGLGYL